MNYSMVIVCGPPHSKSGPAATTLRDDGVMRQQIFLEGRAVHCFPCGTNKKPTTPHGFKDACADLAGIERLWRERPGPLVGVRSGQVSGVSVIDVDPRRNGNQWYEHHRNQLPTTRVHQTQSDGLHLLYQYAPELPNTVDRIASGIETINDNRYFIWWPAAGYKILVDAPLAPFPQFILDELAR